MIPGGRSEDGTLVLWFLGMCLLLLTLAGLGLDLWRGLSERRALAGIADAAAFAAASAIDEQHFRSTGEVRLDAARVRAAAGASIAAQSDDRSLSSTTVEIGPAGRTVTVSVVGEVPVTLLRLVSPGPLRIRVVATAEPRLSS